ncbi:winged helix-turn-helix domain-containing protein [Streptomyces sp. NPDC046977]|uniref:winged helix-turn-helix domain-containing protein n=1 Tax=Streptomyces sp. NPDC046977 TaxID=3154703 RepID=UPI0033D3708D
MTTWKERHDEAVRQQAAAWQAYLEATADRAHALLDGAEVLGSQAAVARELGVSRATVNRVIKALEKNQPQP